MRRSVLGVPLLLYLLSACATAESGPPEIRYVRPSEPPARAGAIHVREPSRSLWQHLYERLQQSPLKVERAEEATGLLVATYRGNPEPYVDCGWILAYGPQDLTRTPGSSHEMAFDWASDGQASTLKRSMQMDGRMVVRVEPAQADTMVSVDSTYVLTKLVAVEAPSGPARQASREFASFTTGGRGRFPTGTLCQPTGEFERLALDLLPTESMAADALRGSVPATPVAPSGAGLDCTGIDRTYCEAIQIIAPYQEANAQQGLGLAVKTVGGATLTENDLLIFDINFPNFDCYLQVAYLQQSGVVGHVMPGAERLWPANVKHYMERTGYEIAPPYGVEMILALATQQPLFPSPRPSFESAADYLTALRQRVAELAAADPGALIAADHLLIETRSRQSGVAATF